MPDKPDLDHVVTSHYSSLYQFAFSLTRNQDEASDLTQQTFLIWANKGHQLRDQAKVKTWLFTTLHREFLQRQRRTVRFPHLDIESMDPALLSEGPASDSRLDVATVLAALGCLDETFRAPVALFYLEDYSYKEVAEILEIPLGTVKSRLSRGLDQLHWVLERREPAARKTKEAR